MALVRGLNGAVNSELSSPVGRARRPSRSVRLRLLPELGATFETVATLIDATMRGLVIMALSVPDIAVHRTLASPFGTAAKDE